MTDHPRSDEPPRTVRARRERAVRELRELRFVGPSTAATLAAAGVTASDVRERSLTYLELVEMGVDAGVAGRIRREHSLPWASEPTRGARLRRRAGHVRHLREDERSWIEASWRGDAPTPGGSLDATPDGSGDTNDAERAWRERGQAAPSQRSTTGDDTERAMSGTYTTIDRSNPTTGSIEPREHTVPELEEALEAIDDPDLLVRVLRAERAGDDRTTAIDAIERRLQAVGGAPEATRDRSNASAAGSTESADGSRPRQGRTEGSGSGPPAESSVEEVVARTERRLAVALDRLRRSAVGALDLARDATSDVGERVRGSAMSTDLADRLHGTRRWMETQLEALDTDDWRLLSVALLLGLTSFSLLAVLVTVIRPAVGLPSGALPAFIVTTVVGVISLPLRWSDAPGGYGTSLLTGLLGLVAVGLVVAGPAGAVGTSTATLAVYAVVAAVVLGTTEASRRARGSPN